MRNAPLLLLACASACPTAAAQSPAENATELDAIVVTATGRGDDPLRVPAAVDVVDAATLDRTQPRLSLSESLQRIPGVVARDRQNQAQDLQLSIRGFGTRSTFGVRGVRLYTDGIPATMPDGQGQVSHFDLASAGHVEVLRGPYSALHGNAAGGVASLFTAPAPEAPLLGFDGVAGSDGLWRGVLSLRAPFGRDDRHDASVHLSHGEDDGYRDHSASRRSAGHALLRGAFGGDGRYTLLLDDLDLRADDPQGLTEAQWREDPRAASAGALAFDTRKSVRQSQLGLRVEHPLSAAQSLAATAWAGRRDVWQMLSVPVFAQASPLSGGGVIDLARDYGGVDLRWRGEARIAGQPVALAVGAQREVSDERRRGYENFVGDRLGVAGALRRDQDDRVAANDLYAQLDWRPGERWRVNLGARRSDVAFRTRDRYFTADNPDDSGRLRYARTSPVAGVLFRATPWLSLFANAGGGFETPTFSELAYRGDGGSGLNDTLAPARSRSLEAGLRARRDDWQGALALFHTRTRDEIGVASSNGGRTVFANIGDTRRRGVEASFAATLAPRWRFAGAATWIDAEARDSGLQLPGVARASGFAELRWSPGAASGTGELDVVLDARASSKVYANDDNTVHAPGHARVDLGLDRRWRLAGGTLRGFARIENLFDRAIVGSVIVNEANGRHFEPAPGRQWVMGFRYEVAFAPD